MASIAGRCAGVPDIAFVTDISGLCSAGETPHTLKYPALLASPNLVSIELNAALGDATPMAMMPALQSGKPLGHAILHTERCLPHLDDADGVQASQHSYDWHTRSAWPPVRAPAVMLAFRSATAWWSTNFGCSTGVAACGLACGGACTLQHVQPPS